MYIQPISPIIEEAQKLENTLFQPNLCRGDPMAAYPLVKKGTRPLVISAPHAVVHYRHGERKYNEPYTGPLALQLAEATDASAIVANQTQAAEDPNFGAAGFYKFTLRQLIYEVRAVILLDLHGMDEAVAAKRRLGQVEIGTEQGRSLLAERNRYFLNIVKATLEDSGIAVAVDRFFTAAAPGTITRWTRTEVGIPAMQLEITSSLRDPAGKPEQYIKLFHALRVAIYRM